MFRGAVRVAAVGLVAAGAVAGLAGCASLHEAAHLAANRCYYEPALTIQYAQLAYTPIPQLSTLTQSELAKEAKVLTKLAAAMKHSAAADSFRSR